MHSLWAVLFGAFKSNIKQTLIMVAVMTLTATMLFSAFSLLQNANSTIDEVLHDHHTSHLTLWFEDDKHQAQDLFDYFDNHDDVQTVTHNEMIFGGGVLEVNGENVRTNEIVIANIDTYDAQVNRLRLVEGETLNSHPNGVWLSTAFAYGEGIEIGDDFTFSEGGEPFSFEVVGIVFDPIYSSEFMPPRLWINEDRFEDVLVSHGTLSHAINVLFDSPDQKQAVWGDFLASIDYNYLGYEMDYATIVSAHSMLTNIIGASLLGFSIILVFVGAFVIYSVLKRTILQDTNVIGVLKSQGFLSQHIRYRYILQFLIITGIAIFLSGFLGTIAIRYIGAFMLRNLGLDGSELRILLGFSISGLFMIVVVLGSSFLATRNIKTITPTDALRSDGFTVRKHRHKEHKTSWVDNLPIPVQLGIKQFHQKRSQTLFSILLAFFTAFTIFYGLAGIVSLNDSFDNMAFWGEDNRHLTLDLGEEAQSEELNDFLENNTSIKGYSIFEEMPAAILPLKGQTTRMLSAFVYDDFTALNVQNVEGSSPNEENQVAISTVLAEDYNLSIGDSFDITILGDVKTLSITGIYQTVVHMGNNLRLHKDTLDGFDYPFTTTIITLNNEITINEFLLANQETFTTLNITTREGSDMQGVFEMLGQILSPVMALISFIFIGITMIILSNFVLISIFEARKDYGIYKSFGMTTNQVRVTLLSQFILTTLIGSILGILIGMITVPFILLQTMQSFGFLDFPFSNPVGLSLFIPISLLLVVSLSIWVSTSSIKNVSPRELITE